MLRHEIYIILDMIVRIKRGEGTTGNGKEDAMVPYCGVTMEMSHIW